MRRRNWKELLKDRAKRILLPLIFGSFFIVPISGYLYQEFNNLDTMYLPNGGHLWFLGNIFIYVLVLCPIFFVLKRNPDNLLLRCCNWVLKFPAALYLFTIPFIIEAELVAPPQGFASYANTPHGFWLGLLAFLTGFIFISLGDVFWRAVERIKIIALGIAIPLFLVRMIVFQFGGPFFMTVIESWSWLFAVIGFGSTYLNRPSSALAYLSKAVYPVYILHMIFLNLSASLILSKPTSIEMVSYVNYVEADSPAQKAGLI
ncbi:MAG TPA: acyltransferase, partial [Candidatus Marinimicrobia bacterium]|nr:acyltransferase [Candidatus Neomarinimicrobiota bacterium]